MTREDLALALLSDADPVPDELRYALGAERRAHLDAVEQWSDSMTETRLRQIETGDMGRPRWLIGAVAALAAVAVGIVAVILISDDGADVVSPVPETRAITYTGQACVYDGPTEFSLAGDMTFTFTNESDAFGGVTLYPVGPAATVPRDGSFPLWIRDEFYGVDSQPGATGEFTASPSEPGRWMMVCGTSDGSATEATPNIDRYATILEVLP